MAEQDDIRRQERIEAYVGGKLAGEELRAFEAELATDEQLRQDVEVERTLAGTLQRSPELRFRDLVQRVSDEQERGAIGGGGAEKPVIPIDRGRWRWLAAAASVAMVIGVVTLWFKDHGSHQYLKQYAYTEIRSDVHRGYRPTDLVDSVYMKLHAEFESELNQRTFTSALAMDLNTALANARFEGRYGVETRIMLARLRMAQGEFKVGLHILEQITDPASQRCDVRFYRSIALFGTGERSAAKHLLAGSNCKYPDEVLEQLIHPQ